MDFEGPHPIEGAKEVSTVMTRHVSRAVRLWLHQQRAVTAEQHHKAITAWKSRIHGVISRLPVPTEFRGNTVLQATKPPVQPLKLVLQGQRLRVVLAE